MCKLSKARVKCQQVITSPAEPLLPTVYKISTSRATKWGEASRMFSPVYRYL